MRRNNLFAKFIITLTLVALLTIPVGRVTGVFALAVTPELQPVYDTKVIQLQDYVDNVLTDAQVGMFNTLMGTYAAAQAGLNDYELEYPYNDSDGVIGWLQRMGEKLYDTIIDVSQNPIIKYSDPRTYLNIAVDYALGVAQSIRKYASFQDLMDDIDASTHYFIPIDPELQASINSYVGLQNGFYDWQFDAAPFENLIFNTSSISAANQVVYDSYVNQLIQSPIEYNVYYDGTFRNLVSDNISEKCIFFNTTTQKVYITDLDGNDLTGSQGNINTVYTRSGTPTQRTVTLRFYSQSFTSDSNTRFVDLVNQFMLRTGTQSLCALVFNSTAGATPLYNQFINHVYVGANWALKHEIFNISGLDLAENVSPSYDQIQTNMLIDIKGLLVDLVNQIDLNAAIIANLFNADGTLNINPSFLKVSIELPDDIVIYGTEPMPVDLNHIQYYTENEYLDVVRERVDSFSDTVGSFVAFWHNTDYEIVYAVFGSALIVLLGAFIGKWGHS